MTADQTKLLPMKPCPFCGGEPHMHDAMGEWWVHCIGCGAGTEISNTSEVAISAWNRRSGGREGVAVLNEYGESCYVECKLPKEWHGKKLVVSLAEERT